MPAAKVSQAVIRNAISAAVSAGLTPSAIRLGADGSLTLDFAPVELDTAEQMSGAHEQGRAKKWGEK